MQSSTTLFAAAEDEKTTAIVKAARDTFLAYGFDAASMDKIACCAGVSKRTVYNRFRSKEELFSAAITQMCKTFVPADIETMVADDAQSAREFLRHLCLKFVTELMNPTALSLRRIAAFEAARTPSIGKAYMEGGPQWLVQKCVPILVKLQEQGFLKNMHDPKDALWRLGTLTSEPLHSFALMGLTPENLEEAIAEQVEKGLNDFLTLYGA